MAGYFTGLTTAQVAALTSTQIAALTPADMASLTTAQIQALSTTNLNLLPAAIVQAITTADIAALTTTQIAALTTTDVSEFTQSQVDALTPAQLVAMNSAQIAVLNEFNVPPTGIQANISFSQYINIISGVGGSSPIATRSFMARVFSINPLIDPNVVLTFGGGASAALAAVGAYFGLASHEYLRATQYFQYISPMIRQPQAISFSRWCNVAAPCTIYGADGTYSYATLAGYTAGEMQFDFNGTLVAVTGISLAAATSLSTVASILQTALQTNSSPLLATATVTYDNTNGRFIFTAGGSPVSGTFSMVQMGTPGTTDLAAALGWYATQGAYLLSSAPADASPTAAVSRSVGISNNFGSFCFTEGLPLTLSQIEGVAAYNATKNNTFQYHVQVSLANSAAWSAALIGYAGLGLEYLLAGNTDYPEMGPMSILAATDFTQRNGVLNYNYRVIPGLQVSVGDDVTKATLDALRINYYGQTQTAGQQKQWLQQGNLCGSGTAPQAMNLYANEQWLKDLIGATIVGLQLSLPELSANAQGMGQILGVLQGCVQAALFNGTISVGKTLTTTQQLYITEQTGNNLAWIQVQNAGYWIGVQITSSVQNSVTIYTAQYTLIYSKNDAISTVSGSHVLI